jgi:hypothetical protein
MPEYMLLIYTPAEGAPPTDPGEQMARWEEYTRSLVEAGLAVADHQLHRPDAATTVRVRDGETLITDGPFAETAEYLAGYYLLDCPDLDVALRHAARAPNAHYASIEVRPVVGGAIRRADAGAAARA